MDLGIGAIARQVTAPLLDAASLARTGAADQIASFLHDNPDQRGVVETALAASGRTGELSAIIDRAGAAAEQTLGAAAKVVDAATAPSLTAGGTQVAAQATGVVAATVERAIPTAVGQATQTLSSLGSSVAAMAGQPVRAGSEAVGDLGSGLARSLGAATAPAMSEGAGIARAPTRSTGVGDASLRVGGGGTGLPIDARTASTPAGSPALAGGPADAVRSDAVRSNAVRSDPVLGGTMGEGRLAALIGVAVREGRLVELIGAAAKDGRLTELLQAARASGRLPELVAAARTLEGVIAAFAGKGGLSATELALFARAGLLSPADAQALRAAGVPIDLQTDEPLPTVAQREAPAEELVGTDRLPADGVVIAPADPALARFDAGAIRIASRAAVETYGVLGPPGGLVVAADAFEALVRAADGDLGDVERRLGLDAGTLRDPDTLIAHVERRDLAGLRLAGDGGGAAAWLPGGERAGGLLAALADLRQGTPFREMTFAGQAR